MRNFALEMQEIGHPVIYLQAKQITAQRLCQLQNKGAHHSNYACRIDNEKRPDELDRPRFNSLIEHKGWLTTQEEFIDAVGDYHLGEWIATTRKS